MRRKTVREKEQKRAEESEIRRLGLGALQNQEAAPAALELPGAGLRPYDHEVVALRREYDHALRQADLASSTPAPSAERPLCELHGWDPKPRFPGAPRPRRSMCPGCLEDATRKPVAQEVYLDGIPQRELRLTPRQREIWDRRLDEREAAGEVIPGTRQERQLVAAMDARRDEATRGGTYVAYHNPFTGVTIRRTRRRRSGSGWSRSI